MSPNFALQAASLRSLLVDYDIPSDLVRSVDLNQIIGYMDVLSPFFASGTSRSVIMSPREGKILFDSDHSYCLEKRLDDVAGDLAAADSVTSFDPFSAIETRDNMYIVDVTTGETIMPSRAYNQFYWSMNDRQLIRPEVVEFLKEYIWTAINADQRWQTPVDMVEIMARYFDPLALHRHCMQDRLEQAGENQQLRQEIALDEQYFYQQYDTVIANTQNRDGSVNGHEYDKQMGTLIGDFILTTRNKDALKALANQIYRNIFHRVLGGGKNWRQRDNTRYAWEFYSVETQGTELRIFCHGDYRALAWAMNQQETK